MNCYSSNFCVLFCITESAKQYVKDSAAREPRLPLLLTQQK